MKNETQQQVIFRQNSDSGYQSQMSYQDPNQKIYDVISDGSVSLLFCLICRTSKL
jgi:hypothetical protein